MIREHRLNRLVVASCSPRTHEILFQETLRESGLNQYLFAMTNIRDQCSWVHREDPVAATEKAVDLMRMAVGPGPAPEGPADRATARDAVGARGRRRTGRHDRRPRGGRPGLPGAPGREGSAARRQPAAHPLHAGTRDVQSYLAGLVRARQVAPEDHHAPYVHGCGRPPATSATSRPAEGGRPGKADQRTASSSWPLAASSARPTCTCTARTRASSRSANSRSSWPRAACPRNWAISPRS